MATMTVSLPDPMKAWIEEEVRKGDYATASDFMRELVRKERERREPTLTLDELRTLLAEARAGGDSTKSFEEIIADGDRVLKEHGTYRD